MTDDDRDYDFVLYGDYRHPNGDHFREPLDFAGDRELAILKARAHLATVDPEIHAWVEIYGPGIEESLGVERDVRGDITVQGA
jgi:hypothetical protein